MFCVLSVLNYNTQQQKYFFLLFIDFRERQKKGERETSICCSTHLCIHWVILIRALTGDWIRNLGLSGWHSNQLSYLARAKNFRLKKHAGFNPLTWFLNSLAGHNSQFKKFWSWATAVLMKRTERKKPTLEVELIVHRAGVGRWNSGKREKCQSCVCFEHLNGCATLRKMEEEQV